MNHRSDESSPFMSFLVAIIVGCALLGKCKSSTGEWSQSAGDVAVSFFTTLGWLALFACIGFIGYWCLDFIIPFMSSGENGDDNKKSFEHKTQDTIYVNASSQNNYRQGMSSIPELVVFKNVPKPIEMPPMTDEAKDYSFYQDDMDEDDNDEPSEMSPY